METEGHLRNTYIFETVVTVFLVSETKNKNVHVLVVILRHHTHK